MSNIPRARELVTEARKTRSQAERDALLMRALRLMHRSSPDKICTSRFVQRIDRTKRRQIINLRRDDWSVPDIAIKLGVNARSVSHIINGQ